MNVRANILITALYTIVPVILFFMFFSIYRENKRKGRIKNWESPRTIAFISLQILFAAGVYGIFYLICFRNAAAAVFPFAFSIYFLLEWFSRRLVKLLRK